MNKPVLVMLCGPAFAGKTRLALAIADLLGHQRVSLDDLNAERGLGHIGPEDIPVEEWERSSMEAVDRIRELLAAGAPVVLDDANGLRRLRDRYRAAAAEAGVPCVLVHLPLTAQEGRRRLLANRAQPARMDIADALYDFHLRHFEHPGDDEPHLAFPEGEAAEPWVRQHASALLPR